MASSLVKSAERGDYEGFWRYLHHNPFIGEREKEQALWVSIRKQNPDFTRMLLEAKCDPNTQKKGETPLQYVARQVETEDIGQITHDLRSFGGHTGICVASPLRVQSTRGRPQHASDMRKPQHVSDTPSPRHAGTWVEDAPLRQRRTSHPRSRATWATGATTRPRATTPPARYNDWAVSSGSDVSESCVSGSGGASRRQYRAAVATSMKRRADRLARTDSFSDPWACDSDSQPSESPTQRTRSFGEYYTHGYTGSGGSSGRHAGYAGHHAGYDSRPQACRPQGSFELSMFPQPNAAATGHSYGGHYGDAATHGHRSERMPSSPRMSRSPKARSPTMARSPMNGVGAGVGCGMASGSTCATESHGAPFGKAPVSHSVSGSRAKQNTAQDVGTWRNAAAGATPDWLEEGLREERTLERNLMEVRSRIVERTRMALASQRTQHQDECVVCQDAERTVLFLPCSHLCTCPTCAGSLLDCPLCRAEIQQKLCVYK